MSRRNSEQVVFPGASSCFSEDEWALLQQWQKNLYGNVMKEIHQALMSLGPLIATTVCSLSAKEKQDLCPQGIQNSSRRKSIHTPSSGLLTNVGVLNTIQGEDVVHLTNPKETSGTRKNVCQNAAVPILVDDQCVTEESGVIIIDPIGAEEDNSDTRHNPGFPVVTAVFSLSVNDEKTLFKEAPAGASMAQPVAHSESAVQTVLSQQVVKNSPVGKKRRTNKRQTQQQKPEPSCCAVQQGAGAKRKRRPKRIGDSLKGLEKTKPGKLVSGKNNTNEKPHSQTEAKSTGQDSSLGSGNSLQRGSKATKLANFILSLGTPNIGISDAYGDCESNPSSSLVSNAFVHRKQEQPTGRSTKCDNSDSRTAECSERSETEPQDRKYACTKCDKCFLSKDNLTEHRKMHSNEKRHKCTECGKCYFLKAQLVRHYAVHSVTKKFQCMFCPKGYDQKHNIEGHIRTHTGEKPYKCPDCGKEFTWRSGFVVHQRRHEEQREAKIAS